MRPDLEWCDSLIVHYLGIPGARMIVNAPAAIRVMWSAWGRDYYDILPHHASDLLQPSTRRLLAQDAVRLSRMNAGNWARLLFKPLRRRLVVDPLFRRAVGRVDVLSSPLPSELQIIRCAFGDLMRAEYAQLNYASIESTCGRGPRMVTGRDILVGNSASTTNNHADVFDLLSRIDVGDRRVVVPLSYGDGAYRDAVIEYGRRLLGDRLEPIVTFLPLDQYNQLIARCDVAIMGHRRQEALGNILSAMHSGARLFLDSASPAFRYLIERGAVISRLDDLSDCGARALTRLTTEERDTNRAVLAAEWSHEVVGRNARRVIEKLSCGATIARA